MPTTISSFSISAIIDQMRASGRTELVHYAGASRRDSVANRLVVEWLADPAAGEATLKSRALKHVCGWDVTPAAIHAFSGAAL